MTDRTIFITDYDLYRLRLLLDANIRLEGKDTGDLRSLKRELDNAQVVRPAEIPPNVITMNSRFRLRDVDTNIAAEYTLVFPGKANISRGMLSVLAPIGTSVLGCRELDTITCNVPAGQKHFEITEVVYQPEAADAFHL